MSWERTECGFINREHGFCLEKSGDVALICYRPGQGIEIPLDVVLDFAKLCRPPAIIPTVTVVPLDDGTYYACCPGAETLFDARPTTAEVLEALLAALKAEEDEP